MTEKMKDQRKDQIMKRNHRVRMTAYAIVLALVPTMLAGCAGSQEDIGTDEATTAADTGAARVADPSAGADGAIASMDDMPDVAVRFGADGQPFTFVPERNETALALVRNITEAGVDLPIFAYEGFEGDDVMQYYDVPSRYDIPLDPHPVASEQAGEVYFSAPDRIMLFYRDAQMEGDFTLVGRIEDTEGLATAVEDNPVLEGYSNKTISVAYVD